jgi:hypothetical protein
MAFYNFDVKPFSRGKGVSSTYGKRVADTIVENCGNTLILRCSASEHGGTSEFASKLIGQREVTHTTQSRTRRVYSTALKREAFGRRVRSLDLRQSTDRDRLDDLRCEFQAKCLKHLENRTEARISVL